MSERAPIRDVNIEVGDDVSKMLYAASKLTHNNRPGLVEELHASFSGTRTLNNNYFPRVAELKHNIALDGVGTKVEIAERMQDHRTIAFDLMAMVVDDAVVRGGEPYAIGTVLDVRDLDDTAETFNAVRQLAEGYVNAAHNAGVVIVNGETAQLGDRVGGYGNFNYNWASAALWMAHPDRVLSGMKIRQGDSLVGLAEHGFRSNGITDVRMAMLERYGDEWQHVINRELSDRALGQLVLRPSTIYAKFVTALTGGYDLDREPRAEVHGVAHITGGGQPSKIGRLLEPSGLGVVIDDPLEPPTIMKHVQEIRGFSDEEAYGKWHMGPGMVIVTPEPDTVIAEAESEGISAQRIGEIPVKPCIVIKNRGAKADDNIARQYLTFQ